MYYAVKFAAIKCTVMIYTIQYTSMYGSCMHELHSILPSTMPYNYVYLFLAGDVWFSLNGTTYQNNSCVTLEDIGEENDTALLCMTNFTACCRAPYTDENGSAIGNWFFPNGTVVPSSGTHEDFYRTRGRMMVALNRRRGGVDGIYSCEIPDSTNVTQTIYIGVYTGGIGECYMSIHLFVPSFIILSEETPKMVDQNS